MANAIKESAPDQVVILTVHEMKRLARNAAELMQLSSDLERADISLELLTGPLTGIYDPTGMGAMFFAVLDAPSSTATTPGRRRWRASRSPPPRATRAAGRR
ncbi:recombinase family protein [Streptomyces sp. RB6PN25]|uniref:Recombinase family protein n=1 Tax=Streptomyces humicola TaxID=2953240 RepID=A0ABT1Q1W8_9ACTN|nr:recombinase family protein [Streptomyces humicola]MCQ4083921.1 recombinase family protein [Streptomyces humicola]